MRTESDLRDQRPGGGSPPLLEVEGLQKLFPVRRGLLASKALIHAVDGVDLSIREGETLGLVGESGSGKSTLARLVMRLLEPSEGRITYKGEDITHSTRRQLSHIRREIQMVFQDPYGSLDSRMTVGAIVAEPMKIHGTYRRTRRRRVRELLELVGLSPEHANRFPAQFSGGQRQRIGIARALGLEPRLLILDEPVSALDVSIQAQVLNLLKSLQEQLGLTYLLIAHDLAVVRHLSNRLAVMYLGKIVETGDPRQIYTAPAHPYTQALLSAIPASDPDQRGKIKRIILPGDPPDPANPPSGCRFRTRCWKSQAICIEVEPELIDRTGDDRLTSCHFAEPVRIRTSVIRTA